MGLACGASKYRDWAKEITFLAMIMGGFLFSFVFARRYIDTNEAGSLTVAMLPHVTI